MKLNNSSQHNVLFCDINNEDLILNKHRLSMQIAELIIQSKCQDIPIFMELGEHSSATSNEDYFLGTARNTAKVI